MAEPSTGALAVTAAVGMTTASLIPGIDVNAVVGAFAGAMFFVVFARELTPWSRFGYFLASWVLGYYVSSGKTPGWLRFIADRFGGRNG